MSHYTLPPAILAQLPASVTTKKQVRTFCKWSNGDVTEVGPDDWTGSRDVDGFKVAKRPGTDRSVTACTYAEVRWDDQCRNRRNSFSVTGWAVGGSCGCIHDQIAKKFPELRPLIKYHMMMADGPTHYLANTMYHANDRDHNGLRAGEVRQIRDSEGGHLWIREAISTKYHTGPECPRDAMEQQASWKPWTRTGVGKARDLAAARSGACWPDATDADLLAEPDVLAATLAARLPALMAQFKRDVETLGMEY